MRARTNARLRLGVPPYILTLPFCLQAGSATKMLLHGDTAKSSIPDGGSHPSVEFTVVETKRR